MTTPAEFLARVTLALQYMEPLLPAGSAVLFMPLVDGRVLYDTLHAATHPIGVTYADLYDCFCDLNHFKQNNEFVS